MKKFLTIALCAAAFSPALAQETTTTVEETVEYSTDKYKVETNYFKDNWFVTFGVGGQLYFGDHNKQMDFADRLTPAFEIGAGKWFTPGIGARLMLTGLSINGATQNKSATTGEELGKYWLEKQNFKYFNLHADVLFNLSNLICGYSETRVWNISPYLGIGWMHAWDGLSRNVLSGSVGFLNSWKLSSALDLNLDVRGTLANDRFDGEEGGRNGEGVLSATIGLAYKFNKRNWDRTKTVVRIDNNALNELRRRLGDAEAENARLQKALAEKKTETLVHNTSSAAPNLVIFPIGKSTLSDDSRVNLGFFAQVIKTSDPKTVYVISGYADSGTGKQAINDRLSKERAQAVYDCLTREHGVNPSQLRVEAKGGVENMFYNDPRLSRAVITRSE